MAPRDRERSHPALESRERRERSSSDSLLGMRMARVLWVIAMISGAATASADAMPSPGRPEFPEPPQPEPAPIPLEVGFAVGMMAMGMLLLGQRERAA